MSEELFTEADVLRVLADEIADAGGQSAFARKHGIRPQEVSDAVQRRRPPGAGVLTALQFLPVARYLALHPVKGPEPK